MAAYDCLTSGMLSWCRSESWAQTLERALRADLAAEVITAPVEGALHGLLEQGAPGAFLSGYMACADVDVVVLGSQGLSRLARALPGGTAENLLHTLDCDTLVVCGT